ncbi:hypothetical protein [Vibrio maritimus]|uniref:hypothetical protein n=1 Tax=Vibrio maritimus TaxID=990268 RepID=UPI001F28FBF7|nr:hypothetical protein [Vibrio maritimus]
MFSLFKSKKQKARELQLEAAQTVARQFHIPNQLSHQLINGCPEFTWEGYIAVMEDVGISRPSVHGTMCFITQMNNIGRGLIVSGDDMALGEEMLRVVNIFHSQAPRLSFGNEVELATRALKQAGQYFDDDTARRASMISEEFEKFGS